MTPQKRTEKNMDEQNLQKETKVERGRERERERKKKEKKKQSVPCLGVGVEPRPLKDLPEGVGTLESKEKCRY